MHNKLRQKQIVHSDKNHSSLNTHANSRCCLRSNSRFLASSKRCNSSCLLIKSLEYIYGKFSDIWKAKTLCAKKNEVVLYTFFHQSISMFMNCIFHFPFKLFLSIMHVFLQLLTLLFLEIIQRLPPPSKLFFECTWLCKSRRCLTFPKNINESNLVLKIIQHSRGPHYPLTGDKVDLAGCFFQADHLHYLLAREEQQQQHVVMLLAKSILPTNTREFQPQRN